MGMMNIWIFNHYALPPNLPGGTRHYDLGRELVKRGHRVVIFATSFHHYLHRETRLRPGEKWKVEDVDGVRFVWIRTPPYWRNDWRRVRNMVIFALRAWWLGRKLTKLVPEIGKPDVVIGSSPHLLTPLAAYWVARHHRVSFVMEVRDLWPQTIIDMGELSAHHPITKALQTLERFLYHRAEKIISLLAQADKYITAYGIPQEKIVWIPNGVDLSRFEGLEPCVASENGLKVIYLGAHGKANALDTVIQAAKILQDWGYRKIRFVLIGDGPEKPRLIGMAQTLGLKNVEFRKPVPKIEIPKVLREADAFIVQLGGAEVYRWGISSNKLFDFMAVGRPVFSSAEAPLNPVKEAKCGFTIPPWDPKALAEAVIKLYQMSPEERAEMGKRGREYVEKYHDIRKLAAQLENLLQSVLSEKRL
jgi:glycosyltransferase involved in cell wall biosynthesis